MSKIQRYRSTVLSFLMFVSSTVVMAANTALTSGAWETGSNWSSGFVPSATDMVIIPMGINITVNASGDVCGSVNIASAGVLTINAGQQLTIGGNLTNAGTFTAAAGSTITFSGASNSTIGGGGSYTIAGTVVLNMASATTTLDVQDAGFIAGINSGGNYYFTFMTGTWKMDNTGILNDCYNSGSTDALTIPFGTVIESDAGTMNLCKNAATYKAKLSGKLFVNGGTVNVQTGQSLNAAQDFVYFVNGGTPQLYMASGYLNIGAGFNGNASSDYIDFHMTGGTLLVAANGYSSRNTFMLQDVAGGKTFMSGGLIIMQEPCDASFADLDMGGANVAATQYSVTGGTVQLGNGESQSNANFFSINSQPATNYPNIDCEPGVAKTVGGWNAGNVNLLSLHINSKTTFNAADFSNINIISSNGTFAFDNEGVFTPATNTVAFSGVVSQVISSSSLSSDVFYNLKIANTSGHVILGIPTTVNNQLSFTSGLLDASNYLLTIKSGAMAITGTSLTSYVITGDGVTQTGSLNIKNLPVNTSVLFPVGNSTYYLPVTINPGANSGTDYSVFVFQGATVDALSNGTALSPLVLSEMVNAVWNITQTAGSGDASLGLDWSSSGTTLEGTAFQGFGTNIGITQYTGGAWQSATGSGNVATQTATSSFSSFTQFSVIGDLIVLPITLNDFSAVPDGNKGVLLSWLAYEDADIQDFEVQKSSSGIDWNTIGKVRAIDGASTESAYSLIDAYPANGVNYYRLKIRNIDGAYTYSPIRTVNFSAQTGITVYPNPANTVVTVSNTGGAASIRLINPAGQVLQWCVTGGAGSPLVQLNTSGYPSGIYFLQVLGADKILQTISVIIAH